MFTMNKFFTGSLDQQIVNEGIDSYVCSCIDSALASASTGEIFTVSQLDELINADETLREYIVDGCNEFGLELPMLDAMSSEALTNLIDDLDQRWCAVFEEGADNSYG